MVRIMLFYSLYTHWNINQVLVCNLHKKTCRNKQESLTIIIIIIIVVFNKSWQAQPVQNIDSELYNRLNDSLQAEPVYKWK